MTDHDLLIQIIEQVKYLQLSFDNHLVTHATYTLLMFGTMFGAIGTLIWNFISQRRNNKRSRETKK